MSRISRIFVSYFIKCIEYSLQIYSSFSKILFENSFILVNPLLYPNIILISLKSVKVLNFRLLFIRLNCPVFITLELKFLTNFSICNSFLTNYLSNMPSFPPNLFWITKLISSFSNVLHKF